MERPHIWFNFKEYLAEQILCSKCCRKACCKRDHVEDGFVHGRELLQKEINIFEMIKSRRYFNKALLFLLTKQQRKYLKARSRYR